MLAVLFTFSYAIVLFALAGEAQSIWLRWVGFIFGAWMAIAGGIAGWQAARNE